MFWLSPVYALFVPLGQEKKHEGRRHWSSFRAFAGHGHGDNCFCFIKGKLFAHPVRGANRFPQVLTFNRNDPIQSVLNTCRGKLRIKKKATGAALLEGGEASWAA